MKTRVFAWIISLGLTLISHGQDAEAQKRFEDAFDKSEEKTIAVYPDAANLESPLSMKMKQIDLALKAADDPLYYSPDKPYLIAKQAADVLGIAPVAAKSEAMEALAKVGDVFPELNEYKNVTIRSIEPDGIRIMHESGAAKIPIERLTPAQREAYGLSTDGAAAYRRQQAEAAAAIRARQHQEYQQRRNQASQRQDHSTGMSRNTQPSVSDAQAKEAAFQAWTAQGGGIRGQLNPGRREEFRDGPMKGMIMEEARQRFESIWASTPESVKEKYRQRAAEGIIPPRKEEPVAAVDTFEIDRRLQEIALQQQEAERKRQEMEWQAERKREEMERQQQKAEHERREIERQQEEIERKQREIERQLQ